MADLMPLTGETDAASATGQFSLDSEWFESTVTYIKVDKGLAAKLWILELSGEPVDVIVEQNFSDPTDATAWKKLKVVSLPSAGHLELDHRKPIIITAKNDTTYFRLSWSQATAGKSYVNAVVEFDTAR